MREALLASLIAITPDLDVLFSIYRSQTHSLVVLAAIALPLLAVTRSRKKAQRLVLLGALGVLTHLLMGLFEAPMPLLWPILNQSLLLSVHLDLHLGSFRPLTGYAKLTLGKSTIGYFSTLNEPLISEEGLGIALILLTPAILAFLHHKLATGKPSATQARDSPPS
jgi:membrane-bound metal-dependent hydrolase YbcI (DUF457 family)